MKYFLLTVLMISISNYGFSQVRQGGIPQGIYFSTHGNWTPTTAENEAVFGGNNKRIKSHFLAYRMEFMSMATRFNMTELVKITFIVTKDGMVEEVKLKKKASQKQLNDLFIKVLTETSGKWKPKMINSERVDATFTMWGSFFSGPLDTYRLEEIRPILVKSIASQNYEEAEKLVNIALTYAPLDSELNEFKADILDSINKKELKKFLSTIDAYGYEFATKYNAE